MSILQVVQLLSVDARVRVLSPSLAFSFTLPLRCLDMNWNSHYRDEVTEQGIP